MAASSGGITVIAIAALVVGGGAGFMLGRGSTDSVEQVPADTVTVTTQPSPSAPTTPAPATTWLPDFTGMTAADAQSMLLFAGWDTADYKLVGAPSVVIEGYRVTGQRPAAGTEVPVSSEVVLTIAK